ncbi:MAG: 4Fe-4S binding protein [Chitinispirillaceae bacterium]|nr:4Fe-4S binding protein [Chitinispirillaceae bacterium]
MTPLVTTVLFMAALGSIAAIVLIAAARFFAVPADPRVEAVLAALPGVNCGACGYSGCAAAAAAVVRGESGPGVCLIGKAEVSAAIAKIMQQQETAAKRKIAYLCCSRNTADAKSRFSYNGPADCRAAMILYGGGKTCAGGCIGHGTCETACPVDAITMKNNLPVIDPARCTGCGLCVKICPKNIIALIEDTPAAVDKKRCAEYCMQDNLQFEVDQEKCIKCGICFKNCPVDAIVWEKGRPAFIEKEKCIGCYTCMRLCPPKVIG